MDPIGLQFRSGRCLRMKTLDTKQNTLDDAGLAFNFDRKVYFDPRRKKVFSVEFIEDHAEEDLERFIHEDTGKNGWKFYFNSEPPEPVKHEIEAALVRR